MNALVYINMSRY